MPVVFFSRQLPTAFDSASLLGRRGFFAPSRTARLRVTSRNAEIIDLDAYRERRPVADLPASAVLASVEVQVTPSPSTMAITSVFWPTWVFGPFVVTPRDADGFGAA
jgi:hypothetical protein